jgi:acyl carrier protein
MNVEIVAILRSVNYNKIVKSKTGGTDMVFDKIRDIIVEQLNVDKSLVTADTNLMKDLEADSLDAVEIIMGIEEEFGIEIPDDEAEKFQTVGDLVKYVENAK